MYSTPPPRSSYITQLKDLFLTLKPFIETLEVGFPDRNPSRHEKPSIFQMSIWCFPIIHHIHWFVIDTSEFWKKTGMTQRDSNIFSLNSSSGQNKVKYLFQIPKLVGGFNPFEKY